MAPTTKKGKKEEKKEGEKKTGGSRDVLWRVYFRRSPGRFFSNLVQTGKTGKDWLGRLVLCWEGECEYWADFVIVRF